MKRAVRRAQARQDWLDEVRYYRSEAGAQTANRLIERLQQAVKALEDNPAIGSPALGKELGIRGLRTWLIKGFPLVLWYFDRDDCVDIVRLVGQRQDPEAIAVVEP